VASARKSNAWWSSSSMAAFRDGVRVPSPVLGLSVSAPSALLQACQRKRTRRRHRSRQCWRADGTATSADREAASRLQLVGLHRGGYVPNF